MALFHFLLGQLALSNQGRNRGVTRMAVAVLDRELLQVSILCGLRDVNGVRKGRLRRVPQRLL
jgi:hypothetical protein